MPIIIPANSAASGGYEVANSQRFNSASSNYLNRTFSSSPTLATKCTLSLWLKMAALGTNRSPIFANGNGGGINLRTDDQINFYNASGSLRTTQVFRDTSAWYHIVFVTDTTLGTADDRLKVYVNGTQVTDFSNRSNPSQNATSSLGSATAHDIGRNNSPANYYNGYISELVFIDGQALDPTSFGEFDGDSEIWKPINVSALTFGTNGYYLDFEDSSALGNDAVGSNNFGANAAAIDQSTDTCTNNFCTLNPLIKFNSSYSAALSNGNTTLGTSTGDTNSNPTPATFGITTGKWYWETKFVSLASGTAYALTGIMAQNPAGEGNYLGGYNDSYGYGSWNGVVYNNGGSTGNTTGGATYGVGDILSMAFDADNNRLYYYKNGAIQNSGTGIVIPAASTTVLGAWFPAVGDWGSTTHVWSCNFGSPPYAISSGNQDGNDYGNFEYAVPSGYLSLNTKNLSEALS